MRGVRALLDGQRTNPCSFALVLVGRFHLWQGLVREAVARRQTLRVYYLPEQVGQGEVIWSDLAAHSTLRDSVTSTLPKDRVRHMYVRMECGATSLF